MTSGNRISEILSWYPRLIVAQKANLARILNHGALGGTGKLLIFPVDQDFEHGPARSFAPNPVAYNPSYLVELAIEGGFNALAFPLGAVEISYDEIKKAALPVILKCNNHDMMMPDKKDPLPAVTAWVDDAVRLGCQAVGFTVYPGSAYAREMYQQVKELVKDAQKTGLIVVIWTYPRGSGLPDKDAESAVDVVAYAVRIGCQLGGHIIKCKPPTEKIGLRENEKVYADNKIRIGTLSERVHHVVYDGAFSGKRIIVLAGGEAKEDEEILAEIREVHKGGGFGSIIGRNSFQRPKEQALSFIGRIIEIYKS